jgi:hypothetical protein
VRLSMGEPVEGLASVSTGPHVPMTTSAGHFLSMQPATGAEPRAMTWVRADEFDSLLADRDKYRRACERVLKLFTDAPDPEVLEILEIVERALK